MISEIDKKIKALKDKKVKLNDSIKKAKKSLKDTDVKIKELYQKRELLLDNKNFKENITVEYLQNKYNSLVKNKELVCERFTLHATPLKQTDLKFYQDKLNISDLKYRFSIVISLTYGANGNLEPDFVYLCSFSPKGNICSNHTVIRQSYMPEYGGEKYDEINLNKVFEKYVQLRNEYLKEKIEYKDSLIPIKIYTEKNLDSKRLQKYLNIIKQKGDFSLLKSFAEEFDLNTGGYYRSLTNLSKEQLHEIAQTIRDNKEQLFRWSLSYKWKDQMKEKVEFDMTPIFEIFEKYNVYIATPSGCLGYGKHWCCKFTLDGRKYEVEY